MKSNKHCSKCGSPLVYWDSRFKGYVCQSCNSVERPTDLCPHCGDDEHISLEHFLVCLRCGTVYMSKDKLDELKRQEESGDSYE